MTLEGEADADHKRQVDAEDKVVDGLQLDADAAGIAYGGSANGQEDGSEHVG